MKKAVVICMLLLYGSATIGATVYMHYCMNRLTGISLWANNDKHCDNCGMLKEKSHGCCKDECKQLRMQADQHLYAVATSINHFTYQLITPQVFVAAPPIPAAVIVSQVSHAPPGIATQKLYLQHSVWRI